ncbi:MAG TPA: hypothetical protein GX699_05540 [Firmicutes bacterium]|nr:hypothetical protein [Bacillota bacterium]
MSSSFLSQAEIEELMKKLQQPGAGSGPDAAATAADAAPPDRSGQQLEIKNIAFSELTPQEGRREQRELAFFGSIPVKLTLELGRTKLTVREILNLQKDSVIKLDKLAGENALLLVNGKPLAAGEVVVINENFGCRVAEFGPAAAGKNGKE